MKRVIIAGAASGIGAQTARQLRAAGHQVVGLDLAAGDDIVACDVRDQASVDAAIATAVERLGGLDTCWSTTPASACRNGRPCRRAASADVSRSARRVVAVARTSIWTDRWSQPAFPAPHRPGATSRLTAPNRG